MGEQNEKILTEEEKAEIQAEDELEEEVQEELQEERASKFLFGQEN